MANPPEKTTRVKIDTLEIDATIRQEHADEAEVTEHPVEKGADPADHVRRKPTTLTLECVQSATPLHIAAPASVGWPRGLTTRVKDAYAYLLKAMDDGRLLPVTTALRAHQNMEITSLRVTRESKTGDCLAFSVAFKQVTIVSNQIEIPIRGKGKKNLGKQPSSPTKAEPSSSTLHDWILGSDAGAH